jgi:predicted proteasome-type protease
MGIVIVLVGSGAIVFGIGRLIHSSIQRPTLIIGEDCFQIVVRDRFVKIHIPYKNIRQVGLITSESTGKAISIGVNLCDLNDPTMHYQNAARSKKWTGWDYAIGNKEIFAVPIAQIYQQLQQALKRAQEGHRRVGDLRPQ